MKLQEFLRGLGALLAVATASFAPVLMHAQTATTTASTTSPSISNVQASSTIDGAGATISWTTDVPSDSQVQYGTSTNYGIFSAIGDTIMPVVNHILTLAGLIPDTLYHFVVWSRSASSTDTGTTTQLAFSGDQTFMTFAAATSTATSTGNGTGTTTATSTGNGTSTTTATSTDTETDHGLLMLLRAHIDALLTRIAALEAWIASHADAENGSSTGSSTPPTAGTPRIDQNGGTFRGGGSIDFGGRGFAQETDISVVLNGATVGRAHADNAGNFSTGSISLPTLPGTYTYSFVPANGGTATQATVTVQ